MSTTKDYNALANAYCKAAIMKGTFEYYTLYERMAEKEEEAGSVLPAIQKGMEVLLSEDSKEACLEAVIQIDEERNKIIEKMKVLTAYTDILQIYEYILNRMELRYEKQEEEDQELFLQDLSEYLFFVNDDAVIHERIKVCIGQLPVRMTKNRYFDLVRESLSVYKGSDKESVESYLYMLRAGSMLYQPQGMDTYFTEFNEFVEELKNADFAELSKEDYKSIIDKLANIGEDIIDKLDFYVCVQELLNSIYTVLLAYSMEDRKKWKGETLCKEIIRGIYSLFQEGKWGTIPEEIEEKLVGLEGEQEIASEKILQLEGILQESNVKNMGESLLNLEKMGKLMSTSIFIELNHVAAEGIADEAYINKVTKELMEELSNLFAANKKILNRAVMACTLDKMPIFFESSEDVMEYITKSLDQCSDFSEKNVSMKILRDIMEDR